MPRPTRIEYEGAFHHVMNRGRHNQTIFRDDDDYEVFLNTLSEVTTSFYRNFLGLNDAGSACYPIAKIKKEIIDERWCELVSEIGRRFYIVQYT